MLVGQRANEFISRSEGGVDNGLFPQVADYAAAAPNHAHHLSLAQVA